MKNILVIIILLLLVGAAAAYLYKARKKGRRCIGCPNSGHCSDCGK